MKPLPEADAADKSNVIDRRGESDSMRKVRDLDTNWQLLKWKLKEAAKGTDAAVGDLLEPRSRAFAGTGGPPPLEGQPQTGLPPLEGDSPPLEADAALDLDTSSHMVGPALPETRSVSSYEGIPESELDTSIPFREPGNVDEAIRLASHGATSSPAEEARKALLLARDLNVSPDLITGHVKEFEAARQQEVVQQKIASLPAYSRLTQWMSENRAKAAVVQKELDQWGTLDWLFGKFSYDPQDMQAWAQRHANQEEYGDNKFRPNARYERPGWFQALGRSIYSSSTSMQNMFMATYGPDTKEAHEKQLEQIKKQRDISMFPIPGETVYIPDEHGGAEPAGKEHPVLRRANSLIGMAPLIGASMIHPALGAGLIYAESSGRTYEDMRLQGYEHGDAENAAHAVGYVNASIAIATGGMFKFSFLPKATITALGQVPNAALGSIGKNPTFWRAAMGLGKNFVWSTVMNMGMAANEVAIKEAYDSAKQNRPYSFSKVASATADASDAWAEMLALSVVPAIKEHQARKLGYRANAEMTQDQMDRARFVESVYNNYEDKGQALRSMHEASQLVTAVQALKNSEFAKSNPEDARDLVQKLAAPRASQTVYLRPEAVAKMPPDALEALGAHDVSLGANGGKIPVNITDLILHPDAEALVNQTAGGPDLLAPSELGSIDLGVPSEVLGQNVPDEKLAEWLAADKARMAGRDPTRQPTQAEIHSAVQGALDQDVYAPRNAQGAMPPGSDRRAPAPDLGPKKRAEKRPTTPPPMTEEGIKRWALDAVGRLPTSELGAMAGDYKHRAEEHNREEKAALRGERTPESETRAHEAGRKHAVTSALHDALTAAVEETRSHVDFFSKQASDEPLPKGGLNPRRAAWYAGQEFGAAHDAIMQATGLANNRSYAAPDLSDIYDKLARLNALPKGEGFKGWDLPASNASIAQHAPMPERTLEDLRMLRSVLEQLGQAADAENSVRSFGIRVGKAQMRNEIAEHLKNLPNAPPGQRMATDDPLALGMKQDAGKDQGQRMAELNKPSTLMLKLGKIGEALWFEGFVPGSTRENAMWGDIEPVIRGLDRAMPGEIRKMGKDKIEFPDGSLQLRRNVWDMVLKLGTHGTDSKVARGFGFRDDTYKDQSGNSHTITAEQQLWEWIHKNMADTPENAHKVMDGLITPHWKLFENYLWPQIEKMFMERGLAPPEKLAPSKLTIHGKEYQGSYGGRLKWLEAKNKPVINAGSFEALLGSDVTGPYTDQRHLAERDPDFAGHPLFSWDGLVSDIKKEIHDVAMRPFLEDAHKIFSDGEIRQLIGDKMGKAALNQIYNPGGESDWLHTVARGSVADVQSAKAWTQTLFKFQGRAAYSAFSLNTRVMLGQLSHIPAAAFGLGIEPASMTAGVAAAFNPDRRSWAHAASEVLRLRYANYEDRAIELTRQLTGLNPGGDAVRRTTDHANWMAWREMDAFLSHAIWEAAYDHSLTGLGESATHEQAVRAADIAVTRMMPSQDIYDQSAFVRDRSVLGFSYMVRNFPNTLVNVGMLNWWSARLQGGAGTWQGAAGRTKATAQYVGMVLAAEILGKGFIMQGGPRDRDDKESWYQARLFGAMAYPYMIGEPINAAWMALQGDSHGARQEMDRMTPASITVLAQGLDDIGRMLGNGDAEAGMRAAAHLSGLILKTPLTGAAYNLSNAARNSEDPLDAVMKGMGYRQ